MNDRMPEAGYRQALSLLRQGQWDAARETLLHVAGTGFTPAIKELGILELHGIGCQADVGSAVSRFQQSLDEPESQFELSRCLYFGYGLGRDQSAALHWLKQAAKQGFAEALRVMAMLAEYVDKEKAHTSAADNHAQRLMWKAAQAGDNFARYLYKSGLVSAIKISPEDMDTFIDAMIWPRHTVRTGMPLHQQPGVTLFDGALSRWQCEYIRFRGAPHLRPSMVLDPATGKRIQDPVRKSDSAGFDWFLEDIVVRQIMQAATALVGIDVARSEPLHLLRYGVGQEYKPHYDFVGGLEYTGRFADQQRTDTLCLYLNDVPAGGETAFPRLNLSIPPKAGQMLHFQNVDAMGRPFVDSLHCGKPVHRGEKWLATLWIRKTNTGRGLTNE